MGNYDYANESLADTLRNNKKTAIGLGVFLAILALLFLVVFPYFFKPATVAVANFNDVIRTNDIVRGKKDSNVTVVLFEDPQCPACQSLSKTESKKLEAFYDRVKFVYKYFRVIPGHTFSKEACSYIYAAEAISGKGYELVEKSYDTTSAIASLNKTEFLGYAKELGFDIPALVEKANSKEIQTLVAQQDTDFTFSYPIIDGFTKSNMRLNGTPGAVVIIDGKLNRVTSGSDRTALVDPQKDFNASNLSSYLEKYFNPNASSSSSEATTTDSNVIPVTPPASTNSSVTPVQ